MMPLLCPHCHSPIELVDLPTTREMVCPACGSSFQLHPASTIDSPSGTGERKLGKFEILSELGIGAFGIVYKARDPELDRIVALKVPRAGDQSSREDQDRFLREARSAAQLRHPNIVSLYDVGQAAGMPYLVSAYVQGVTLADILTARRLPPREAAQLVATVAGALQYAHEQGVIHRDVKPSNIMVGDDSTPYLMDFGLAKREAGEVTMTMVGQVLGTPAYMSPEQARGEAHKVDGRSDVYSLGVILYRLLTSEMPFRGNPRMLLHQVLHDDPRSPRSLNDRIPRDLETICVRAMAKEPGRRYQSARELGEDLRRFLNGESIQARPVSRWERGVRWVKRRPAVAALLAVTSLATLSLLGGGLWHHLQLRAALQIAEVRRLEAERERERAAANLHRALAAVDRMLTRVGEKQLAHVPEMEEERQRLLEDALEFYQGFLQEHAADPALQRETGRAFQRTARIYQMLGKPEQAEKAFRQALGLQQQLTDEFPSAPGYRYDQALSYRGLGDLGHATGQNAAAEKAYQKALDILKPLTSEAAAIPELQYAGAAILNSLGDLHRDTSQMTAAEADFRKAQGILEVLVRNQAHVPDYQSLLAQSYTSMGHLYMSMGQKPQAGTAFQKARDMQQQLVHDHPRVPEYQEALAKSHHELAGLYREADQYSQAETAYQKALDIREQLAREHPRIPHYQHDVARSYFELSEVYRHANRAAQAEAACRKSLAILEPLARDHPKELDFALTLGATYAEMANALRDEDQLRAALDWYARNIRTLEGVLQREPQHSEARSFLIGTYEARSETWIRLGQRAEAKKDWQKMVDLAEGQSGANLRCNRALALAQLGEHARATAEVKAMLAQGQQPQNSLYNFACVYSLSSAAALQDVNLADQHKSAEEYAAQAVSFLAKMHAEGGFQSGLVEFLKKDTDLEPLRTRADFQKLLAQIEQAAKAGTK